MTEAMIVLSITGNKVPCRNITVECLYMLVVPNFLVSFERISRVHLDIYGVYTTLLL